MSIMKAVVLERFGSRYTVLGQDGTFRQVRRKLNAEVGEEVLIQPWTEHFSGVRVWAGAVALFLLVLTTLFGWNLYQAPTAVALLSVDINPSLQFVLDSQGNVIKLQTENGDAKRMLSQIDVQGKPIEEVLAQIVKQAYDQKMLNTENNWVVVGYSSMTNKTLEQMPKELNENQINAWVTAIVQQKGSTPHVVVFSLSSRERELAQKGDLTLGEYALWQAADKAGIVTPQEKLKDSSERTRLLENPQVQRQIKSENERQSKSRGNDGDHDSHHNSTYAASNPTSNITTKPIPKPPTIRRTVSAAVSASAIPSAAPSAGAAVSSTVSPIVIPTAIPSAGTSTSPSVSPTDIPDSISTASPSAVDQEKTYETDGHEEEYQANDLNKPVDSGT